VRLEHFFSPPRRSLRLCFFPATYSYRVHLFMNIYIFSSSIRACLPFSLSAQSFSSALFARSLPAILRSIPPFLHASPPVGSESPFRTPTHRFCSAGNLPKFSRARFLLFSFQRETLFFQRNKPRGRPTWPISRASKRPPFRAPRSA